jgi:hypothetical protein
MLAAAISGVTYSGMSLLSNPTSGLGYLFGAGMGVAEIAMNISSQSMIARRYEAKFRQSLPHKLFPTLSPYPSPSLPLTLSLIPCAFCFHPSLPPRFSLLAS